LRFLLSVRAWPTGGNTQTVTLFLCTSIPQQRRWFCFPMAPWTPSEGLGRRNIGGTAADVRLSGCGLRHGPTPGGAESAGGTQIARTDNNEAPTWPRVQMCGAGNYLSTPRCQSSQLIDSIATYGRELIRRNGIWGFPGQGYAVGAGGL